MVGVVKDKMAKVVEVKVVSVRLSRWSRSDHQGGQGRGQDGKVVGVVKLNEA